MPVIAMTREMGTLGKDVANRIAERLQLSVLQHEIVEHVADKMHLGASAVDRFLEGRSSLRDRWSIDRRGVLLYTTEEILDVAAKGNVVIRGWGATYVLRLVPHVLCVRVCASMSFRARVMAERLGLKDETMAVREIEQNDAAHGRLMQELFHVDWKDPSLYDVVLNTERMNVEGCASLIEWLVAQPAYQETPESHARLADLKLVAQVRSALQSQLRARDAGPRFRPDLDVTVEPATGVVTVSGLVPAEQHRQEVERIVRSVSGVKEVQNRTWAIHPYLGT